MTYFIYFVKGIIAIKNLGAGVAKKIQVKYLVKDQVQTHQYQALGPGQEVTIPTLLPLGNDVSLEVSYQDGFNKEFTDKFIGNVNQSDAPKSEFSHWKEEMRRDQEERMNRLLDQQRSANPIESLSRSSQQ